MLREHHGLKITITTFPIFLFFYLETLLYDRRRNVAAVVFIIYLASNAVAFAIDQASFDDKTRDIIIFSSQIESGTQKLIVKVSKGRKLRKQLPFFIDHWKENAEMIQYMEKLQIYEIRLSIENDEGDEMTLSAFTCVAPIRADCEDAVSVHAVMVEANGIVLLVSISDTLRLWEVGIGGGRCLIRDVAPEWTRYAKGRNPIRREDIEAKLYRSGDGRIMLSTYEKSSGQHAWFEQLDPIDNDVRLLKMWNDDNKWPKLDVPKVKQ